MIPPFRLLYHCLPRDLARHTGPARRPGEPLGCAAVVQAIDEVAGMGVDTFICEAADGWLPGWPHPEYVPIGAETADDTPPLPTADLLETCVRHGWHQGLLPWFAVPVCPPLPAPSALPPMLAEHPEWRLKDPETGRFGVDWRRLPLRQWRLSLLADLLERPCDGLCLDFADNGRTFPPETPAEVRRAAQTDFVGAVRVLLGDATLRTLAVRLPDAPERRQELGLEPQALADAGADFIIVSPGEIAVQALDPAPYRTRQRLPVVLELPSAAARAGDDWRRLGVHQYHTAAHLVNTRLLDGLCVRGFQRYRPLDADGAPGYEPPFHVLGQLPQPSWLIRQPQHYFHGAGNGLLPRMMTMDRPATFAWDLSPPPGGWREGGRGRLLALEDLGESMWQAELNGYPLVETEDRSEPFPHVYTGLLGRPRQRRAWLVPANLVRDGVNELVVTLVAGPPATVVYLDLALK